MLELEWALKTIRILYFAGPLSLLVPIWVGYKRWDFLLPPQRVVLCCCWMWIVLTIIAESLPLSGYSNAPVWNLVVILEGLLLGYAFYLALRSIRTRKFLRVAAVIFSIIGFADYFYLSGLHTSAIYTIALESILLIIVTLLYFEQSLQELRIISLKRDSMFLIGVGVIVYFAGTVMIFLLEQSVSGLHSKRLMMMINSILSVFLNCIIARAFWLVGREESSSSFVSMQ